MQMELRTPARPGGDGQLVTQRRDPTSMQQAEDRRAHLSTFMATPLVIEESGDASDMLRQLAMAIQILDQKARHGYDMTQKLEEQTRMREGQWYGDCRRTCKETGSAARSASWLKDSPGLGALAIGNVLSVSSGWTW